MVKKVRLVMEKYIHLNYILRYIRETEGREFKIIKSEDYGIDGILGFRMIIPSDFNIVSVKLLEEYGEENLYNFEVLNDKNENAINGPNIVLWNSELYSTNKENNVCVAASSIDEGLLIFENFERIPIIIESSEIIKYM